MRKSEREKKKGAVIGTEIPNRRNHHKNNDKGLSRAQHPHLRTGLLASSLSRKPGVDALGPRTRGGVMTAMCCKLRSQVGCSAHAADSYKERRKRKKKI